MREIINTYGERDVLDFYFLMKTYEVGMELTNKSRNSVLEEAMARKEALGFSYAMSFLNKIVTDKVKINLTIGTEYVKGNNEKARELLDARQPKDDEPNIKDVISGDYSRK